MRIRYLVNIDSPLFAHTQRKEKLQNKLNISVLNESTWRPFCHVDDTHSITTFHTLEVRLMCVWEVFLLFSPLSACFLQAQWPRPSRVVSCSSFLVSDKSASCSVHCAPSQRARALCLYVFGSCLIRTALFLAVGFFRFLGKHYKGTTCLARGLCMAYISLL